MQLEHIGIAVRDVASALKTFESLLCELPYKSETVESEGVRTHFIRAGGPKLELLEALDEDSPVARHIEKRGPGLHHLAFEVDDLEEAHRRLSRAGFRVLGNPRRGADGKDIFFVHPQDTAGVLFEFCRQKRSILSESEVDVDGEHIRLRKSSTQGPPVLFLAGYFLDETLLARHLEQRAKVIAVEDVSQLDAFAQKLEPGGFHLLLPTSRLDTASSLDRARSLVLFVDAAIEKSLPNAPLLIAARPPMASTAADLYVRSPDADLVVAEDHLIALAIERHIDRATANKLTS